METVVKMDVVFVLKGGGGAGLLPWVGGPLVASFGFYLREAFQCQIHTEKILYNKSH